MGNSHEFIGYGRNPAQPENGRKKARIAITFVMNYEEGYEPSIQDGEGRHGEHG